MNKLIIILVSLLLGGSVLAKDIQLKNGHPVTYTVKRGDTLWSIAAKFLHDPLDWPEIFYDNPDVTNPSRIYPGQVLELAMVDGRRIIQVRPGGTIKLRPRVRREAIDDAIPTIPLESVRVFLNQNMVVSGTELNDAPIIVGHRGEAMVSAMGSEMYVENLNATSPGLKYTIFRQGGPFVDPESREILGYEAIQVGTSQVIRPGQPASLLVLESNREVAVGDRLLAEKESRVQQDFVLHTPAGPVNGFILSVFGGVTQVGNLQTVAINKGTDDGIRQGDMLAVFQQGELVNNPDPRDRKHRNIQLPNERVGELVIFRTYDKVSYGLVMHAIAPIHLLDRVYNPSVDDPYESTS